MEKFCGSKRGSVVLWIRLEEIDDALENQRRSPALVNRRRQVVAKLGEDAARSGFGRVSAQRFAGHQGIECAEQRCAIEGWLRSVGVVRIGVSVALSKVGQVATHGTNDSRSMK